jgi:hypothetical protein
MEVILPSETSVYMRTTRCYITEDGYISIALDGRITDDLKRIWKVMVVVGLTKMLFSWRDCRKPEKPVRSANIPLKI